MTCQYCGTASVRRYCCRFCRVAGERENAHFGRRLRLNAVRGDPEPFPAFTAAMRTALAQWRAWKHRTAPAATAGLLILCLLTGCHRRTGAPVPRDSLPVAAVAVSPYDFVSPFICRMTVSDVTCMASVDVRFRRGQAEMPVARGYQFSFTQPKGVKGTGAVWFGCAGQNECGPGFFMFGSPSVSVVPAEPARYWNSGSETLVPHGSLGIVEIDIANDRFTAIRNRWSGSIAPPLLKAGPGLIVSCTDQACTVSVK